MRNFIAAAIIAFSAPLAVGSVAEAATTKVIIKQTDHRPHRTVTKRHVLRSHGRDCFTKKVVTRVRGERVVQSTRVCR